MTNAIPWREPAIVVQVGFAPMDKGQPPTSVFEGSLLGAVRFLRDQGIYIVGRYRISLPDRRCAPFEYQGVAIEALLAIQG